MKQETNQYTYESFYVPLLFVLLLVNTLYRSDLQSIIFLGDISTSVTFAGMFVYLIRSWIDRPAYEVSLNKIYLAFILFVVFFFISFLNSDYMNSLEFINLLLLFFYILGSVRMTWRPEHLKIAGYVFSVAIIFFFIHWVYSGFPMSGFKSVFRNENYFGVLTFCMLYFNMLAIKYGENKERLLFVVVTLMNLLLMLTTSARSILIALAVIVFAWIILKSFRKHFYKLFYIVMFGNLLFVGLYVGIKDTFIGKALNDLSVSIFNKNLFSGRNDIWASVIQVILEKPWFGHGAGIRAFEIAATEKTAHNMYLQVLLELGLFGFILFILLLGSIWYVLNKRLQFFVTKWSACFMLGILVYNTFELTLMQNNYSIAAFQWLIMTIGIGFTTEKQKKNIFAP